MKNLILTFGAIMLFTIATNAQSVAGKYANSSSTWEFIETSVQQEYEYKGYNKQGKLISVGFAFYSKKQERFVVIFKRLDKVDDIGYASCKLEGNAINVKTLNPDGSVRWNGGKMNKK